MPAIDVETLRAQVQDMDRTFTAASQARWNATSWGHLMAIMLGAIHEDACKATNRSKADVALVTSLMKKGLIAAANRRRPLLAKVFGRAVDPYAYYRNLVPPTPAPLRMVGGMPTRAADDEGRLLRNEIAAAMLLEAHERNPASLRSKAVVQAIFRHSRIDE